MSSRTDALSTLSAEGAPRIGLALAGGGPLGAIYEIGALCALQDAMKGIDFTRLHHYVGVSAGGFIAASLANGISPQQLCEMFIAQDPGRPSTEASHGITEHFDPAWLMAPAYDEFARRAVMLPGLVMSALWGLTVQRKTISQVLERLGASLPTGAFSNAQIDSQLAKIFSRAGRTNDFRQLKTRLTLVATDLDSGESAPFGSKGWDHVPISQAVQASSALPGLFPPVEIDDHYYVDGALKKTMHASVAMDEGVDLMLCLNPLVPFDASTPEASSTQHKRQAPDKRRIPKIVDGGLPGVLSQTFRCMIHSRMELGMKHYERSYPQTDLILIEPDHRDPELYLANTFSYAQRHKLAEHAFQQTRQMLRTNHSSWSAKLARHGISLDDRALNDSKRRLVQPLPMPTRVGQALLSLQHVMGDLEAVIQHGLRPSGEAGRSGHPERNRPQFA